MRLKEESEKRHSSGKNKEMRSTTTSTREGQDRGETDSAIWPVKKLSNKKKKRLSGKKVFTGRGKEKGFAGKNSPHSDGKITDAPTLS